MWCKNKAVRNFIGWEESNKHLRVISLPTFSSPSEVDTLVTWLFAQQDPTCLSTTTLTVYEGVTTRQQSFPASTEPTVKRHRTTSHLSGRQAVSMHFRGPKTPRGSWMCTNCLAVAKRATFVESGKQTLSWCCLGSSCLCLCAKSLFNLLYMVAAGLFFSCFPLSRPAEHQPSFMWPVLGCRLGS